MKIDKNILIMSLFPEKVISHFDETFNTFKLYEQEDKEKYLKDISEQIDGIAVMGPTLVSAEIINALPKLKIIGNFGVGFNHIDIEKAKELGITVSNTPSVLTDCTADIAMSLILMVARRVGEGERELRAEKWTGWRPTHLLGTKVTGKKLGVIGFGRIGQAVAKRAHFGFDMEILYWDPMDIPAQVTEHFNAKKLDTIEDICKESDFVSVNCPATKETLHLMNKSRFNLMKDSAFLINTARGDIVDEKALVDALKNKTIAGAGLDVFETEPNLPSELKTLEYVVSFPHLGSATIETRIAMGNTAIDNSLAFFAKEELPNKVV